MSARDPLHTSSTRGIPAVDDVPRHVAAKECVFPFKKLSGADTILGPEMRSTGEVLGLDHSYGMAYFKAQDGASATLPLTGTVLITVAARDRTEQLLEAARRLATEGFRIVATDGTAAFLQDNGIEAATILKVHEGRPNIVDAVKNGEIQLIINTPSGKLSAYDDSYIRKAAIRARVPYVTTTTAALAAATSVSAVRIAARTSLIWLV